MTDNVTEHALWQFINGMGWGWWGPIAVGAWFNIWGMVRLAPAETFFGRVVRLIALAGFLMIGLSPGNSALGPLGLPLVIIAFFGMTWQMRQACIKEGKIKIQNPAMPTVGLKLAAMLVEHPKL